MILYDKLPIHFDMSHIHPSLVHFPVALILTGYLLYCIYLFGKRSSRSFALLSYYVLMFAALSALVTAFAGLFYTASYPSPAMEVLIGHRFWAMLTVIFVCCAAATKLLAYFTTSRNIQSYDWLTFSFYTLASVCIVLTAIRGVELTFGYLMGPDFQP